nr:ABC transporter substrate-binding protein [Mesorhizobium sp. WSM4875]
MMRKLVEEVAEGRTTGTITRRQLIQGGAAAGLGMSLSGVMPNISYSQEQPKRGGSLKLGLAAGSTTDSLDPRAPGQTFLYVARAGLYNYLIEMDSDKKLVPELAESWDVSKDAKQWVFNIRKGVTFHNGKTLTANDVKYSLNLHLAKDTTSAAKSLVAGIDSLDVVNDNQIRINLKEGNALFTYILTDRHLCIVPENFSDWGNAIGTGGYKVNHFDPGVSCKFTRNPDYWKSDRAWVDQAELITMPDFAARSAALRTGAVHGINEVEKRSVHLLERSNKVKIVASPDGYYSEFVMRCNEKPFDNNNVRQAIKYAIDREQVVKKLLAGFGSIGNDQPIPSSDPYFNKDVPTRAYDPEKAKWHLKQAGLSSLDVELFTSSAAGAQAVDYAVLFGETAKPASINVALSRQPADGYWDNIWMKRPFLSAVFGVRPSPDLMFSLAFDCAADWNESAWCNDKFQSLLQQGRVELDESKRKGIYGEMQSIVSSENGCAIFAFEDNIDAYSTDVKGLRPDAANEMMGDRVLERVWM